MSYWNQQTPYGVDKAIIAFADDVSTPYSVEIQATTISPNADGIKAVPEGLFVCQTGGMVRLLPRARVLTAFSTSSPNAALAAPYNVFIPGDVLYVTSPSVSISLSGSWATNDTITLTVGGVAFTSPVGSSTIATAIANFVAAANASGRFSSKAELVGTATKIYVYSASGSGTDAITVATSGSGTIALDASATGFVANNTAIGTILSINNTTGAIVLSGNAAIVAPVGASVGVRVDSILGVYPHSLDFTNAPTQSIAPVYSCRGVYKNALPYYDSSLATALPNILFSDKF